MKIGMILLLALAAASLLGCAVVTPAPGAADLKVTNSAAEVASCTAVGNVDGRPFAANDQVNGPAQMRNEAVGLGADTLLVTSRLSTGVAYRCGKGGAAGR